MLLKHNNNYEGNMHTHNHEYLIIIKDDEHVIHNRLHDLSFFSFVWIETLFSIFCQFIGNVGCVASVEVFLVDPSSAARRWLVLSLVSLFQLFV